MTSHYANFATRDSLRTPCRTIRYDIVHLVVPSIEVGGNSPT